MPAMLIALAALTGTVTLAGLLWAWRTGHSTVLWQQYRMEDQPRVWPEPHAE